MLDGSDFPKQGVKSDRLSGKHMIASLAVKATHHIKAVGLPGYLPEEESIEQTGQGSEDGGKYRS